MNMKKIYASGAKTKGKPFEVRVCLNCDRISYSTPCSYCGGGVFKFIAGYKYQSTQAVREDK